MTPVENSKSAAFADIGTWLRGFLQQLGAYHDSLGSEQKIWFWIVLVATVVAAGAAVFFALRNVVRRLNDALSSPSGWRPIRFSTTMWAGTGIWAMIYALMWRLEGFAGWSVLFALGAVAVAVLVWFMVRRLGVAKAAGAVAVNSGFGCVLSPVVIQLGLVAILLVLALIVFLLFIGPTPRPVYVINR